MNLKEIFEKFDDEYGKFDKVENKKNSHPDLHAFILLDKLVPAEKESDIISASENDEFFIDVDIEKLEQVATEENILELVRCGVIYDKEFDCLLMLT
jgi:hypothetical protein